MCPYNHTKETCPFNDEIREIKNSQLRLEKYLLGEGAELGYLQKCKIMWDTFKNVRRMNWDILSLSYRALLLGVVGYIAIKLGIPFHP